MMPNYLIIEYLKMNKAGWYQSPSDGSWRQNIDEYEAMRKPYLGQAKKILHQTLVKRGGMTADFEHYFYWAKDFLKANTPKTD